MYCMPPPLFLSGGGFFYGVIWFCWGLYLSLQAVEGKLFNSERMLKEVSE